MLTAKHKSMTWRKSLKRIALVILCFISMTGCIICQINNSFEISKDELGARLRFLSSDLLQGRYPGTQGEKLTTAYLISELESFGVSPGVNKSWYQPVSIVKHWENNEFKPEAMLSGRIKRKLEHGKDILFSNYTNRACVDTIGDLVFVGFGINAPMYGWNDFNGIDLHGKIAVVLLGEPSVPDDSTMFNGIRASRYSSWVDKMPEMERLGAIGVLCVVPEGSITNDPVTGVYRIEEDAARSTLLFTGIITDSTLSALLPPGSPLVTDLFKSAVKPGFCALPLGVRLGVFFQTLPTIIKTNNVVGVVQGTDSLLKHEHIVISSHWDAYGITAPIDGDSICNGALDDGSGLTIELALARVIANNPQPRSVTFLFATAEEFMLLGAEAFIMNGPLPTDHIIANFNLDDGFELFGVKRDIASLGVESSSFGQVVSELAHEKGLRVTPDQFPEEGFFLRADNYPFARAGIPALYMALGTEDENHPAGWTKVRSDEYLKKHYHKPSDNFDTVVLDLGGALQLAEITRDLIIAVAKAKERPYWIQGSEFSRDK